jgi:hypothetical protein
MSVLGIPLPTHSILIRNRLGGKELNVAYLDENNETFATNSNDLVNRPISLVFRVEVYNRSEKMVLCSESLENKVHLDTKNLEPGTYFLHIISGKEVLRKQILIK